MTVRDFKELGRADRDFSGEREALQIAGFEGGAEAYGADHDPALAEAVDRAEGHDDAASTSTPAAPSAASEAP